MPKDYFEQCNKLMVEKEDPIDLENYDCKPAPGLFVDLHEYDCNMSQSCIFSCADREQKIEPVSRTEEYIVVGIILLYSLIIWGGLVIFPLYLFFSHILGS